MDCNTADNTVGQDCSHIHMDSDSKVREDKEDILHLGRHHIVMARKQGPSKMVGQGKNVYLLGPGAGDKAYNGDYTI